MRLGKSYAEQYSRAVERGVVPSLGRNCSQWVFQQFSDWGGGILNCLCSTGIQAASTKSVRRYPVPYLSGQTSPPNIPHGLLGNLFGKGVHLTPGNHRLSSTGLQRTLDTGLTAIRCFSPPLSTSIQSWTESQPPSLSRMYCNCTCKITAKIHWCTQ